MRLSSLFHSWHVHYCYMVELLILYADTLPATLLKVIFRSEQVSNGAFEVLCLGLYQLMEII